MKKYHRIQQQVKRKKKNLFSIILGNDQISKYFCKNMIIYFEWEKSYKCGKVFKKNDVMLDFIAQDWISYEKRRQNTFNDHLKASMNVLK